MLRFLAVVAVIACMTTVVSRAEEAENDPGVGIGSIAGGLVGGAIGLGVGAGMGASMTRNGNEPFSGLGGAILVGSALGAVGLGMGVHLGNGEQGDAGAVVMTSVGIGAAGLLAAGATNSGEVLLLTVGAQLVGASMVEGSTAAANRRATPHVGAWIPEGGGGGLMISTSF